VVVEDVGAARREAGDVVLAVREGHLAEADVLGLADLVRGAAVDRSRPSVFKSVGMPWEDLAVAGAAWRRHQEES
jgi:ornithine cyclodeaminase